MVFEPLVRILGVVVREVVYFAAGITSVAANLSIIFSNSYLAGMRS